MVHTLTATKTWINSGGWKNRQNAANGETKSFKKSTRPGTEDEPIQTAIREIMIPLANKIGTINPLSCKISRQPPTSGSNDQAIGKSILGPTPGSLTSSQSMNGLRLF